MCVTTFGKIQSDAKLLIESLRKLTRAMEQNKYTNFNQIKLSSKLTKRKKKKKVDITFCKGTQSIWENQPRRTQTEIYSSKATGLL